MKYTVTKNNKTLAIALMVIGAVSIAYGFTLGDPTRSWANLLISNFYFMAIALGAVFFLAIQYVAEVGWSAVVKRVPMAMGTYLPYAGVMMLIIFFCGKDYIYDWTHHHYYDPKSEHYDPILAGKSGFLNIPFFVIRMVVYFVFWSLFAYWLRRHSLQEDLDGGVYHYKRSSRIAATFLVFFAVTSSTSAWDFIMSVDAHWFSTLFGWYTFAGMFVTAITVITFIILYLKEHGYFPEINENHIHDLGKFMFAFSIFWTYLWFAQFMLIWYANLPEEVTYYLARQTGFFRPIFIGTFFINFFAPFLILMTRDAKRKRRLLMFVGILMFIGHYLDTYLMVMPGTVGSHATIGIVEIGTLCFFAGLFIWVMFNALSKAPLIAKNHPMLDESLHHHI